MSYEPVRHIVEFTSSTAFMDGDPHAAESARVEIVGYIEGTYAALRHSGPDDAGAGVEFAWFARGAWELADGRRFSDWAVTLGAST